MDAQTLAQQIVPFLAPYLPHLLKAAAEESGKRLTGAAWEKAQALWERLRGKDEVVKAAAAVVEDPADPDTEAALRLQLKKALRDDPALAAAVARLWDAAQAAGVNVTASGRSVAVGGDVSGSVIITGDQSTVQQGKYNIQIDQATGLAIGDQARSTVR